jgi:hypothetical protein
MRAVTLCLVLFAFSTSVTANCRDLISNIEEVGGLKRALNCLMAENEHLKQELATISPNLPYKVCTTWIHENWRDSIVVPKSWNKDNCLGYAKNVGGHSYALGCMFDNGIEFGAGTAVREGLALAQPPERRNCGWQ